MSPSAGRGQDVQARTQAVKSVGRRPRTWWLIHDPAHPWTVARLAGKVGASHARFAQRFTRLVGRPPMAYLTEWRIWPAADLLARTDATIDAIARMRARPGLTVAHH
ncbi:AraC-like DNA-binding protein [Thermocatellispora tengchongensis]|uniref:AraC-like DNA-binding protein n=1 Tax=Thermocatellispora tengchongensis TaxID=1073253 RepID=A0A840PNG9_9ACTN|nr:helix-turn-helix domain-containing protein [Thermocatellispora tengchongensis]MBB5139583.1 AraC-like DNA-binding protein [Thermocatellispora tengchongensis]